MASMPRKNRASVTLFARKKSKKVCQVTIFAKESAVLGLQFAARIARFLFLGVRVSPVYGVVTILLSFRSLAVRGLQDRLQDTTKKPVVIRHRVNTEDSASVPRE